jgi:hypothetical protein
MDPSSRKDSRFEVRQALYDRASLYTSNRWKKRKIADRTLEAAALDPALFVQPDIETALFERLHEIAKDELRTDK